MTLVCRQFQDMILSIVHARLLQFYPPKNLPLTLNCCHPAALMDTFRGLCPPATYIDTPGLASDISCTSESNSRHAAWNDGSSLLYSHFVLQGQNIRPVHMDSDEPFFQFCTTLSLSTHVSLSNTVSWLVTRKRTKRLMRAWLAKCATRRLHSAAADKGKQDASDEIQCSNSRSSSEDNIHTMWTDQSENFGLRIRIEDRTLAERSADYRANIHGVEQAASYDMHIQGECTSLHRRVQREIQKKGKEEAKMSLRYLASSSPKHSNAPYTVMLKTNAMPYI